VENKARELELNELLTLSTQAFTYFQSKGGFAEGSPEDLPPRDGRKYEQSWRNSKVRTLKKLSVNIEVNDWQKSCSYRKFLP
jgi:amino-acid N-acetyltransferase